MKEGFGGMKPPKKGKKPFNGNYARRMSGKKFPAGEESYDHESKESMSMERGEHMKGGEEY